MTKTHAHIPLNYLLNRRWIHSVAATLNMKHAIRDPIGTWITLDEDRINQNFCHFLNLLNARYFGPNWRRKNKRLDVFLCGKKWNDITYMCELAIPTCHLKASNN